MKFQKIKNLYWWQHEFALISTKSILFPLVQLYI